MNELNFSCRSHIKLFKSLNDELESKVTEINLSKLLEDYERTYKVLIL